MGFFQHRNGYAKFVLVDKAIYIEKGMPRSKRSSVDGRLSVVLEMNETQTESKLEEQARNPPAGRYFLNRAQ